ncbi:MULTISPECIES: J domain-containing protein [Ralstonia]|uniref:J domain-containing protein n=1 Tax=Ralstonia TaxID=48736 RepID=UPI000C7BEDDE|nr:MULTISPECIES: J domain-containing protein [Ralstonia]PLT17983.1 molecular chaperone DnaJ [Ralstonia mannitolilytica]
MSTELFGPWAVLGIEPTHDARQIKRAYAARLKVVRPDDDAAGFQALREAYDTAFAQCDDGAPPPVVVHLETRHADPEAAAQLPDDAPGRPAPLTFRPAPQRELGPAPGVVGVQHWQAFLAEVPQQDPDDVSDARVEAIETLLRARLQHPDLIHFEAREAFQHAALRACADRATLGTVRMACDNVFEWTGAPMPLDPHERRLWQIAIDRAAGDVQYQGVQHRAKHSATVRRMLQPGPARIPTLRLFMPYFLSDVRKFLEQLRTKWPQALEYRLDHASMQAWDEAARRPWPSFSGLAALAALSAFGALMFWAGGHRWDAPDWYQQLGTFFVWLVTVCILVLPVTLRVAYPVWIAPALERRRARGQLRALHPAVWYGIRIAPPTLALCVLHPSDWYTGVVTAAIVGVAFVHVLVLLVQERARVLALLVPAGMFYGFSLVSAFEPFFGNGLLVLALSDTLFLGLREVLLRGFGQDWQTTRARLVLLAVGIAAVPLQLLLAQDLPAVAATLGWAWFLAGLAAVDPFWSKLAERKGLGGTYVWMFAMALTLGAGLLLSDVLVPKGHVLRGMLILQGSVAWLVLTALLRTAWHAVLDGMRSRRQRA